MKRVLSVLFMLALALPLRGSATPLDDNQVANGVTDQAVSVVESRLFFDQDSRYPSQDSRLAQFSNTVDGLLQDSLCTIHSIEVSCYASPDGVRANNLRLATNRSISVQKYLVETKNIPSSVITMSKPDIAWDKFRQMLSESDMESKDEVIDMIYTNDSYENGLRKLKFSKDGSTYEYIKENILLHLRFADVTISYSVREPRLPEPTPVADELEEEPIEEPAVVEEPVAEEPAPAEEPAEPIDEKKPLKWALKTNAAQLAVGVANIGAEFGLSDHFTIDVPFTYSPYTIVRNWRLRALAIQPEARYWFGETFKGHFVGVHGHYAYFNVSTDKQDRFQNSGDRPLWGAGVSYGYALNLCKRLNLEFNLGAGYASLKHDTYYNIENGGVYESTERNYWGLTRAGISLVYMLK